MEYDAHIESVIKQLSHLNERAASDRPKLPEALFVKHLLPLLYNRDQIPDLDLGVWLDIAGNPHRSIDVVDVKNNVLFTVPPVLARVPSLQRSLNSNDISVSELAYMYGQKAAAEHPAAADAWLERALKNQNIPVQQTQVIEYLQQWVKIYKRYNLPLTRLLGAEYNEPTPAPTGVDNEISGEFDDF